MPISYPPGGDAGNLHEAYLRLAGKIGLFLRLETPW